MRLPLIATATTAAVTAVALALAGCSSAGEGTDTSAGSGSDSGQMTIFATTGYLADAAKNIAPDANVITMVGPGGDPHTYQPTTKDIEAMKNADVVLWNGLHLEAQMIEQLESLGDKQLAVGDQIDEDELLDWPEEGTHGEKLHDPHIWNSPEIWGEVVELIGDKLGEVDKHNAEAYEAAADAYEAKIESTAEEARKTLDPVKSRVLITGHDAFNYFGRTFDFQIYATDFVTTDAKLSATQISELADTIADKKVPAIFQDNQANPQAIKSLQEAVQSRGWDVKIADKELFADTLGPQAPTDTYLGAFKHNADAVAAALG